MAGWAATVAVVQESILGIESVRAEPAKVGTNSFKQYSFELVLVDRLAQRLWMYNRGDLVIVKVPGETDESHAMRLLATEGDWITVPSVAQLGVQAIPKVCVLHETIIIFLVKHALRCGSSIYRITQGRCWVEAEPGKRFLRQFDSARSLGAHPMAALNGRVIASLWPPSSARFVSNEYQRNRMVLHGSESSARSF